MIRFPSKVPRHKFGHVILDSGATSSFIKPNGGAIPTGQSSNKRARMTNGQALSTSAKPYSPKKSQSKSKAV